MRKALRPKTPAALSLLLATSVALTACGGTDEGAKSQQEGGSSNAPAKVKDPIVTTYDGGLQILDGETLKLAKDIPLPGFNRVSPAGDDRHVLVSTSEGFQVLDTSDQELTDVKFEGAKPGHVVHHAGKTVLFSDGTGEVTVFDPADLGDGKPDSRQHTSKHPHHGVALELENGQLVTTLGDEEEVSGVQVLDKDNKEVKRNEDCPGVHGEATAKDEAVVVGCEDGVLIYKDGEFEKVASPDDYGRIGNQAGSEESPILLGDYKTDPDAELERPEKVSLINTETAELDLVDLGTSYTFRSLARGPHGEALVLGTDGEIHVIDPEKGKVTNSISVMDKWEEPLDWQEARPTLFVRDHTAYVSDPATKKLHAIDIESGKKEASVTLSKAANELTGVTN